MSTANWTIFAVLCASLIAIGWWRKRLSRAKRATARTRSSETVMRLKQLLPLVERLRVEAIGEPVFNPETRAYAYLQQSPKVVAVLKIIRAAQGLSALNLLCRAGLFIDFGVAIRCINDCIDEVYFLLESYQKPSSNVQKFVTGFFESQMTPDGHLSQTTPAVETSKIRSARVRYLKDGQQDDATSKMLEGLYKTYSGYVHATHAQIMEVYGGPARNFNLAGIPSVAERQMRMEYVELEAKAVLRAASFVAHTLGLEEVHRDINAAEES